MCETMANIPIEERSTPCVLTEDMFDAAMNQQFAYQDDIESEEESSSQDENMEVDQDMQGGSQDSAEKMMETECNVTTTTVTRENTSTCDSPPVSVLVIETGLDKSKQSPKPNEETINKNTSACVVDNMNKSGCDELDRDKMSQATAHDDKAQDSLDSNVKKLPILKKILSNNCNASSTEPIDLCDSDSEEFSTEEELPEVELIDDELKSVMESNLMAEIGMNVNKQKALEPVINKSVDSSSPKIAVKSMAQVPSNIFNTLPQKKIDNVTTGKELVLSTNVSGNSETNEIGSIKSLSDMPKDEIPSTIHINRIAVPHQTFLNSRGQKMKCVYVRNRSCPLVINSNKAANSSAPKYIATTQIKTIMPKQMPPIVALSNMTLKNMNQKTPVLGKIPTKVIPTAPKLLKLPMLKNAPQRPHLFHLDQNIDSIIKSLLFHNLKKPYKPPDEAIHRTDTFPCLDCSDRFILKSSLNQHLSRRSLSICYWCRICKVQLQFFNRCVFLKHIRGHNCSIKNIDTTCITFSPLSNEVVDSGIATSFLRDSNEELPAKDCILKKNTQSSVQSDNSTKNVDNGLGEIETTSGIVQNLTNKKTTTEGGQNKNVCFQTKTSVLLSNPIISPAATSQAPTRVYPLILPKSSKPPIVVQNIQKQTKDTPVGTNKKAIKNVLLLCRPLHQTDSVKHDNLIASSRNVSQSECNVIDDDVVIDEDTEKTCENQEEEEIDVENITENNLTSIADTKSNHKSKSLDKSASLSLRRVCGECGTSCVNINKHLNGSNKPTNPKLSCDICRLILPTRCSLKIHHRIHTKLPPYKCPDCGKEFSCWDDLHAHVKFSCGHLAKCVRYMCVSCKTHFASAQNLGNHIMFTHSRDIYRCTLCPVAFFNKDSLSKHLATIHPNKQIEGIDYKQCSLCPKKLVPSDNFVSHVQDHAKSNIVLMYGYKCPQCLMVFASKTSFVIHQIKEKQEIEEKNTITSTKNKSKSTPNPEPQEANMLSDSNSDIEEEPVIVRKYPEPDDAFPVEKDPLSLDGWEHTQGHQVNEKREELCIVCKTNAVVILPGIDLNVQSLCCKQCVKPLDCVDSLTLSNKALVNGMARKSSSSTENGLDKTMKRKRSAPKVVQRSFSCDDVSTFKKVRKSTEQELIESDLAIHNSLDMTKVKKKNRKKQNRDKIPVRSKEHVQGQVVASKSPDELVCAKCKFVADTRETFLEHITVHRTDPNAFQCLECGLCFVVLPSLERHLQINHGIKDVNMYTKNNMSSLPEKIVSFEEEEEEETDDNQCRVCHKMFDSIASLEKHFRSHGMAFMNSLSKSP